MSIYRPDTFTATLGGHMRGRNASIGPEDASTQAVLLSYLIACSKSEFKDRKIGVTILHRGVTLIKQHLEHCERKEKEEGKPNPYSGLQMSRFAWKSEDGKYEAFDELLELLSDEGDVSISWQRVGDEDDERQVLEFGPSARASLEKMLWDVCIIDIQERLALVRLGNQSVEFLRQLIASE